MLKRLLWSAVLILSVGLELTACRSSASRAVYDEAAAWLASYALPEERLAAPTEAQEAAHSALGDRAKLLLPGDAGAFTLLAALDEARPDYVLAPHSVGWDGLQAQPWFIERYAPVAAWRDAADSAAPWTLYVYTPSPFDLGARIPLSRAFATRAVTLSGYRLDSPRVLPGEPLHLTLYWSAPETFPGTGRVSFTAFEAGVTLEDAAGRAWAHVEDVLRVSDVAWKPEERLTARYELLPPDDLPAGVYTLSVSLTRRDSGQLICVAGDPGREALALVTLQRPPDVAQQPPLMDHAVDVTLGEAVALVGYDAPARIAPAERLRVALHWHALDEIPGDYKVFVHLLSSVGMSAAQDDAKPVYWFYPTTQWQPGDYVRDEHLLPLPADLARGDYRLVVGMYDEASGDRLPAHAGSGEALPDGQVVLGVVQVR